MQAFIIGPGFIGWNVLELLVHEGYSVTALVRRTEHAEAIGESGGQAILGELNDHDLIAEYTEQSDMSHHLPSVEAVLSGTKKRAAAGKPSIFIHTSGASVLDDASHGEYKTDKVYYDTKPEEIDALSDDAPHREIDLAILAACKDLGDGAKLAIMIPPAIYGYNPNHKRVSIQIPTVTRFALKYGYAGHVGKGLSVKSQIHVLDLSRAYIVLLHHMESSHPSTFLRNPYFFCENGHEISWKEVAVGVGQSLYDKGLINNATPQEYKESDYEELFGKDTSAALGLNSRSRAVRLRQLGWEPREKGIWESYNEDELPEILREEGIGKTSKYGGTAMS